MPEKKGSTRTPKSPAAVTLGTKLRQIRQAASKTTYEIQRADGNFYGSGTISSIEGGYAVPSEAIITAYVGLGGNHAELMTLLQKTRQTPTAGTPETTEVRKFEQALQDVHTDPNILRLGYDVEMVESSDYFNQRRVPSRIIHKVSLHTRSPRAHFFVFRYGYEYDLRPGVASVQAGTGCNIALLEENDAGVLYTVLKFDPSITNDFGLCSFSWVITVESQQPSSPKIDAVSDRPIKHLTKQVSFDAAAAPTEVWWFRGRDPFASILDPAQDHMLQTNPAHHYFKDFCDVEVERCGLAWKWAERDNADQTR
ncbi:MAG: hypothetical protein M3R63_20685 [Actinomycetota bacterium]|nr:hypothetical protein [Actinomycetota bacterium]